MHVGSIWRHAGIAPVETGSCVDDLDPSHPSHELLNAEGLNHVLFGVPFLILVLGTSGFPNPCLNASVG